MHNPRVPLHRRLLTQVEATDGHSECIHSAYFHISASGLIFHTQQLRQLLRAVTLILVCHPLDTSSAVSSVVHNSHPDGSSGY